MDITFSSIVAVQVEESEEVFDFFESKHWIFGDNIFGEEKLLFFLCELLFVDSDHSKGYFIYLEILNI